MTLAAMRGAVGFLSRLPIGRTDDAWDAFRTQPVTFPLVGALLGIVLVPVLVVPIPEPTVAVGFVLAVYLLTGITHLDGVADLGDAAVIHGSAAERREVMTDTVVGTGGVLAVAFVVFGLGTAALALAGLGMRAAVLVVTAEVGAKMAMALLVCVGTAPHEGLGSALTSETGPRSAIVVLAVSAPAALLAWPRLLPGVAALCGAVLAAAIVFQWARARLDGISGDVLGATNEFARIAALHAGVIAWTFS